MDAVENGRITITRTVTEDGERIDWDLDGDPLDSQLIALGMLAFTSDGIMREDDEP